MMTTTPTTEIRTLARLAWRTPRGISSVTAARQSARDRVRRALGRVPRGAGPLIDDLAMRAQQQHNAQPSGARALQRRVDARICARYTAEVERRGGEVAIDTGRGQTPLRLIDRNSRGYVLLGCDDWRYYSRRAGSHQASLRYLCGTDDAGLWAVRVAGTIQSIDAAREWLQPATVRRAIERGRRVRRQGDVYAVETTRQYDESGDLPQSHVWDPETRTLSHHPGDGDRHTDLVVDHPVRFVPQRSYGMGRGGAQGCGD